MIPWSKYHLISIYRYYYNILFVIFKYKYIYIHSFFIYFYLLIYYFFISYVNMLSNFRLDFSIFLPFLSFFHILIHTEYKIRQKETFTNDNQNFIFAKLSLLYLLIYRLDLRSDTISISSETFGKPWFYQLTALYFLRNRSYRYYDQYASDDWPMDLCCRHDRCHSH